MRRSAPACRHCRTEEELKRRKRRGLTSSPGRHFQATTFFVRFELRRTISVRYCIELMGPRRLSRIIDQRLSEAELWQLSTELRSMDDRSAAIIAATITEDGVESILVAKMRKLSTRDYRNLFSVDAPLSTFSAKIRLAYALKCVSRTDLNDLNIIRNVRNVFAHARLSIDFSTADIVSEIEYLKILEIIKTSSCYMELMKLPPSKSPHFQIAMAAKSNDPRNLFISSCLCLAFSLFQRSPDDEDWEDNDDS